MKNSIAALVVSFALVSVAYFVSPDGLGSMAAAKSSSKPAVAPYCLAVRGNGELAPAHWGALARVVEQKGLPQAMSGGSSASISLFLLESIAQNPFVAMAKESDKRLIASLLLKSLQGYLEMVVSRPEWQEMAAMGNYLKADSGQTTEFVAWLQMMTEKEPQKLFGIVQQNFSEIMKSLKAASDIGLIDSNTIVPLLAALDGAKQGSTPGEQMQAVARVRFYSEEIRRSVMLLGKFNAETDQNIFFRAGVVSFQQLASSFGRVANFYAAREMGATGVARLRSFVTMCASSASGRTWNEMRNLNPKCDSDFKALAAEYRNSGMPVTLPSRERDRVGAYLSSFPGTAVLRGSAYDDAKLAFTQYEQSLDNNFGSGFSINSRDVSFGYWGPEADLKRIAKNLQTPFALTDGTTWDFSHDAKSLRFVALGDESWAQVLSTSPAEPGLAPLQEFRTPTEMVYSAGGWSDLHPGAVLKSFGCEDVVYVTRRGGESLFGQGVAKRLLGFDDISWDQIATDPQRKAASKLRNNNGDAHDMKSEWSRLYNLANPESSFNRALEVFDTVVCTDWDRFDVTASGAVGEMIEEAYRAPWLHRKEESAGAVDPRLGYRPYAGCLPF